ncbi:helix-turn-helix domain-containing protein [Planococcus salinarum]|uniref:helix-turn-helix domain-containing protein n=1 Tax=Planococcus salinarum TaxID=622695 RepID=UPI000E3E13FF|nr:helix-turn-helix transcriptional regulator [Planococcus salinarum]TAA71704.1 XRE family transcriptional regulator [Planococcus salinarum]
MNFNAQNFGQILRYLRRHAGLSMLSLAQKLGTSASRIKSWENGDSVPSVKWVVSLSELFDVPYEVLLNTDKDEIVHYSDQQWDDIMNGVGSNDENSGEELCLSQLSKMDYLEKLVTVSSALDAQDLLELYTLAKVKAEKTADKR